MTIKLITVVLIYKIIKIGPFTASVSTFIIPFWFFMGDVITEVYGYKITKKIIFIALTCQFVFAFSCYGFVQLNSPADWSFGNSYSQIFGKLPRVALASFLAIVTGALINSYLLAKWKLFFKGKYFWLRCLGSTAIGEFIFTMIAYLTEFWGVTTLGVLFHLIIVSFTVKLLFSPILVYPASLFALWLKKSEGIPTDNFETPLSLTQPAFNRI